MINLSKFWVLMLICGACTSGPKPAEPTEGEIETAWIQKIQTVEKKAPACKQDPCTKVALRIPVLEGGNTTARSNINRHIDEYTREALRTRLPEPEGNSPLESMADSFLEGYELYMLEFPESNEVWFFEANGEKSFLSQEYYTLEYAIYDYMGGAHPNTYRYLQSFDLKTGEPIVLADRFDMDALKQLAEKAFRQYHKLSVDANLDDAGFFFENGVFSLPANMALTENGLMLLYNPYEVAAYALGETRLFIPYAEIPQASKSV